VTPDKSLKPTRRWGLAAALIAIYGCYSLWNGVEQRNWMAAAIGGAALVAATGVVFRWSWSRWLVYLLAVVSVANWVYAFALAIQSGRYPFPTVLGSALALLPGIAMLAITAWCANAVRRRYNE
jgi:hypothetical protein